MWNIDELNSSFLIFLTLLIAIFLWFIFTYFNSPKNLPPGPKGLPYFGYLPFLGNKPHITLIQLKKKYGNIFTIYVGGERIVVLSSFKLIKEALVQEVFEERSADFRKLVNVGPEQVAGLLSGYGNQRIELRRFTLTTLRNFGMGKASIEPKILDEIHYLIEEIEKLNGKPAYFQDFLTMSVSNITFTILFGKRMEYDDPKFQELLQLAKAYISSVGINQWSDFLPQILINWLGMKTPRYFTNQFYTKLSEKIKEYDMNKGHVNNQDNFIDAWRTEVKKPNASPSSFNEKALTQVLAELFIAGSDTTSTTLEWALLYVIKYPKIQEKIQKEIDDVIGSNRTPTMSDQKRMPYTEATIMEVSRIRTIAPLSDPHTTTEDTLLNGFCIPKDTSIYTNLWALHKDQEIFPEPESFKPERFITEDNKVKRMQELIPFSIGKRQCPGESLARMQLFLYLTSLLQHFKFVKNDDVIFDYKYASVVKPLRQKICAVSR